MAPRRADSPSKISAAAAAARRTFRVGGGGVTILPAAAAQRDRLRALSLKTKCCTHQSISFGGIWLSGE